MGSCTSRDLSQSNKPGLHPHNLDLIRFKSDTDYSQYQAYQKYLEVLWKSFPDPGSIQSGKPSNTFPEWVRKGVPDSLVLQVIKTLFIMDSPKASIIYSDIQKNLPCTTTLISDSLSYLDNLHDPTFYLTQEAEFATKRIVFFLNFILNTSDFKFLPKVVQSLLWFLEEFEVFYLIVGLVKQDAEIQEFYSCKKYFLNSEEIWKVSEKIAAWVTREEGSCELMIRVVKDLIENFAVGLLPAIYYPFLVCNFLLDRFDSLVKLAVSMISCIQLADLYTQDQVRQQIREKFCYFRFIQNYGKINPGEVLRGL